MDHRTKPGSPGDILEHHGVKGMRWGVRKKEEITGRDAAVKEESAGRTTSMPTKPLKPGTPEFQEVVGRLTRTDHPQVITPTKSDGGKVSSQRTQGTPDKHGLTKEQKMLITFGALTAAGAGYYAYKHYNLGGALDQLRVSQAASQLRKQEQEVRQLEGMKLPAKWDVSGLKDGPISKQRLGDLAGGEFNAKLLDADNLVINTSRGYADILPKGGFDNPFAAEQHASVTRVLEEMRDKYPSIRNLNVEVVPMSKVPGVENSDAFMCVMAMRAGEARVMYNDTMGPPTPEMIRANARFLPGMGAKDYVAYHEMGHLLTVAHGELPASFDLLSGNANPSEMRTWVKAEPLLHKKMFSKHGFTFKELSKISEYAATQPAEAMAELVGHYHQPEMRKRLTADQIRRAEGMINEMGGLT